MIFFSEKTVLTDGNIAVVRDRAAEALRNAAGDRLGADVNPELSVEEMLLRLQAAYGEDAVVHIRGKKNRVGGVRLDYIHQGDARDPLEETDDEMRFTQELLERFCYSPRYDYISRRKQNIISVTFPLKPVKNRMLKNIMAAVLLAGLCRLLLMLFPDGAATFLSDQIISPVFNKMTAIISEIATPLVFLSVITGIVGLGSSVAIGKIGKQLLKNMFFTYIVAAVAFTGCALLLYSVGSAETVSGGGVVGQLVTLVLDMIPSNLFQCFASGNDLQVIVLAIFIGLVLLTVGNMSDRLSSGLNFLSDVVNKMMEIACKMLPVIVFAGVLQIFLTDMTGMGRLYKYVIAYLGSVIVIAISLYIRVAVNVKVSPFKIFRAQVETLMINLTTSSQVAAMPANSRCCTEEFGLDEKLIDFSLPIGIVVYMPNGAAFIGLLAWVASDISGIPLDLVSIIKVAILAVIIAIAAPPIPGSAFAVMPILFSACGLDMQYYSIAIILGSTIGYFLPALNGYSMQLELLITGKQLGLADEKKLDKFRKIKGQQES